MTKWEAVGVLKFEKACVLRQDTPRCDRDCGKCDLLLPTEDVLQAYDMAVEVLANQKDDGEIEADQKLTDKEQRIFLAAMGKEEKVCKEVDAIYPDRDPYEDTLLSVCRSIERKVKKALWE